MVPDLSKEIATLDEALETMKALAIRARGRRHIEGDTQKGPLTVELLETLREIESVSVQAIRRLESP